MPREQLLDEARTDQIMFWLASSEKDTAAATTMENHLCRMVPGQQNLAVRGLRGDICHGGNINSYYDDPHDATGRFDFVLANPPFNVNAVDKKRLKDMVGPGRRFPFGLLRTQSANGYGEDSLLH